MVVNFSRRAQSLTRGLFGFCFALIFASLGVSSVASALVMEMPLAGAEKVMISLSEGNLSVSASPQARQVKITFSDGIEADYLVEKTDSGMQIRSRDQLNRADFGNVTGNATKATKTTNVAKKKRDIEVIVPATATLELHLLEGSALISKFSRDVLAHVQKGHLTVKESQGANLTLHAHKGDITVLDSQGRIFLDSYAAAVLVRNFAGDIELQNFAGETTVEKSKGFFSLILGSGIAKVLTSSGSLQFELGKGIINSTLFQGRVEGQSGEGAVNVNLAPESDLNVKAQSGRVTVQTPLNSGALLNVSTQEGEIYGPNYLKVNRDSGAKYLRGRLKGDTQKSTIVVRGQEAAVVIK
jgi:hypothetical protein